MYDIFALETLHCLINATIGSNEACVGHLRLDLVGVRALVLGLIIAVLIRRWCEFEFIRRMLLRRGRSLHVVGEHLCLQVRLGVATQRPLATLAVAECCVKPYEDRHPNPHAVARPPPFYNPVHDSCWASDYPPSGCL